MKDFDESVEALEKYLFNVSDAKLDEMLAKIDAMGITGPSVEEYFSTLTEKVGSVFNEISETSTISEVELLFSDTRINTSQRFEFPTHILVSICEPELVSRQSSFYWGENQYPMAA